MRHKRDLNLIDLGFAGNRKLSHTMTTAIAPSSHNITILGTMNLIVKEDGKTEELELVVR
jgi:hypothetical protein